MWKPLKIKSSVLQLSILVAVMVGVLLISFIALNHTHSFFRLKSENLLQNLQQNESLFFPNHTANSINLERLQVENSFRGGFQLRSTLFKTPQGDLKKMGLMGAISQKEKQTLYLEDNQSPLVLVGDAKIQGTVKIPSSGVKAGVISGTYFNGKEFVRGPIQYSNSNLPPLENGFRDYISGLQQPKSTEDLQEITLSNELKNSFWEPEKRVFSSQGITLYEKAIGNIRFQSGEQITVAKEASLTDVLLVAPVIKIEDGFRGRVHLVARDSIIIGERVLLDFPSSLVLLPKQDQDIPAAIVVKENSSIDGSLIYLKAATEKRLSNVLIPKNTTVTGGVYCEGYLEHYGTIYGNVYTSFFLAKSKGGVYINHLLDGKVLPHVETGQLSHLPLTDSHKNAAQWLY